MTVKTLVKIEDVLGHYVDVDVSLKGYPDKVRRTLTGRVIYSAHNASLFFKPKGSRNKGYFIENENDVHSVTIIRKDNKNNRFYVDMYNNREKFEIEFQKRLEKEEKERQREKDLRQEMFELERKKKREKEQKEIEVARQLGGYDELEKEVIGFYESFKDEHFNERLVKNTYIPILNKLIHKSIDDVNDYPKYFFCKKHNPKFTKLVETMTNIKLGNTQKGNVELLNRYLAS